MARFGFIMEDCELVNDYINKTKDRFDNTINITKNPFSSRIKTFKEEGFIIAIVEMINLYPPFYIYGLLFLLIGIFTKIIFNFRFWIIPFILGLIIYSARFLWSSYPFKFGFKAGLKKIGYNGFIKSINDYDLKKRFEEWDSQKF